ncbi:MAG: hypothetical protein RLZZ435_1365 [Cyanobacteriota bacterium]|jgi:hypothetical protein
MSLRLVPLVPESPSDSDLNFTTEGFCPLPECSGTSISTFLPFVKLDTSSHQPGSFSATGFSPEPLNPEAQSAWVIQATWHLYSVPTPHRLAADSSDCSPLLDSPPLTTLVESSSSQTSEAEASLTRSRPWHKHLRHLVLFSCGAAMSSLLYADPVVSLKSLLWGASLASAEPEALTTDATDFIETAQRQLYHLDRLAAQQTSSSNAEALDKLNGLEALDIVSPPPAYTAAPPPPPTYAAAPAALPERAIANVPPEPPAVEALAPLTPPDLPAQYPAPEVAEPLATSPISQLAYRAPLPIPGNNGGELLGLLEQGDQSMALFKINGTIEQVTVGGRLVNGATFTGTQDGKALLQMGESQVPLAVGQTF